MSHLSILFKASLRILAVPVLMLVAIIGVSAQTNAPDIELIKTETTNPDSRYFYPKLLDKFMANDTAMTRDDYQYFYYGTMFTEDYNPYRPNPFDLQIKALEPVYLKREHLTRSERRRIEDVAKKVLANNPLELRQLMYLVYVYEQNQKFNLAKIWKSKLDSLLLTIARSGTGADAEHARVVVYPRHEFDFFNLSGVSVTEQQFVEPYYEKLTVTTGKKDAKPSEHYFNLRYLLEQYYAKHPSELNAAD